MMTTSHLDSGSTTFDRPPTILTQILLILPQTNGGANGTAALLATGDNAFVPSTASSNLHTPGPEITTTISEDERTLCYQV